MTEPILDVTVELMDEQQDLLIEQEEILHRAAQAFHDAGRALTTIRDQRLYRGLFKTFEEYCEQRLGMSRRQADRLIASDEVMEDLRPAGLILPEKEKHVRPLTSLEPEQRRQVWAAVLASAEETQQPITEDLVKAEVQKVKPEPKQRKENDFYPTAAPIVRELLNKVPEIENGSTVFEPCAGDGAIVAVLKLGLEVESGDIAPQFEGCRQFDAAKIESWEERLEEDPGIWTPDWIITNPPFNQATEILYCSLRYCRYGVAFLLPLTFLEPVQERGILLEANRDSLRYVIPLNPRPQFRDDTRGNDRVTVAWFVWLKRWDWRALGLGDSPFQFIRNWR